MSTSSRTANVKWVLTRSIACSILLSIATAGVLPAAFAVEGVDELERIRSTESTLPVTIPVGLVSFLGRFHRRVDAFRFCWLKSTVHSKLETTEALTSAGDIGVKPAGGGTAGTAVVVVDIVSVAVLNEVCVGDYNFW